MLIASFPSVGTEVHISDVPENQHAYRIATPSYTHNIYFKQSAEDGGMPMEALLTVTLHRLEVQNGKLACDENEHAITHMRLALDWLRIRRNRIAAAQISRLERSSPPAEETDIMVERAAKYAALTAEEVSAWREGR